MDNIFQSVCRVWAAGQELRSTRRRLKRFTYGRQWDDMTLTPQGEAVTEGQLLQRLGRRELTHNLLRSLVKAVVGRFRHSLRQQGAVRSDADGRRNLLDELDARALEEFLISGCAVQRVVYERRLCGEGVWVDNVSPERFFCNRFLDPRGDDVMLLGMLHEMSLGQVVMRHGHGSARRRRRITEAYARCRARSWELAEPGAPLTGTAQGERLTAPSDPSRCRLIEAWSLEDDASVPSRLAWHCRWYAPDGTQLDHTPSPYLHGSHPFAFKFYPLTDGEVHPFIEDVIDQQKYINRLITLIDNIMDCSAKGVLLFPTNAIPEGSDFQLVVDQWNRPGGVIPIDPMATFMPQQVNTENSNQGAAALLDTELRLMQQISGVSGALQGQAVAGNTNSASLYESQANNSAIALADIYETFNSFREARDAKMGRSTLKEAKTGGDNKKKP